MKKKLLIPLIFVSATLTIATVALAVPIYNKISKFKSTNEVIKSNDGVAYSVQGHKENKKISDSIDPISGTAKYKYDIKNFDLNEIKLKSDRKEIKKLNLIDGLVSTELNFTFIKNNKNKLILVEDIDEPYHFVLIPETEQYILEYKNNLYKLDSKKNSITPLLKDDVLGYNKKELGDKCINAHDKNMVLSWGENPSVNLSGTKLTYISNRNGIKNDNGKNIVWIKDLVTNEEKPLGEIGYTCLGWDKSDNVYYLDFDQNVIKINANSGEKTTIAEKVNPESSYLYPYLIIVGDNQIALLNIDTNEQKTYINSQINDCYYLKNNKENLVAFQAREKENVDPTLIVILNTVDLSYKIIQPLENTFFEDYSWLDSETLIVTSTTSGTLEQQSYVININELN